ncbi:MBOAT family protein [bacterium]|nr:MBOAT family protein [bacterium]
MFFNSLEFLIFLPIVVLVYYLLPARWRWLWLLAASYYFYMSWKAIYALLIIGSTLVDFFAAKFIYQTHKKRHKQLWLGLSLLTNLGLLAVFKYYNFFRGEAAEWLVAHQLENWLPVLQLALPVGISFYTFQTLSYTIDVYYGRNKPEKHFGIFALYVSFFPQLVAGPIERFSHLGGQLKEYHPLVYSNFANGFRLVLFGLFVKMAIADNVSPIVDQVYEQYAKLSSQSIATGLFFYALQIYADFYGYSLIAVGAARLLGISLVDNFKAPYLARSVNEFWKRWHISLTTWFREYLYLPLGGNRVTHFRWLSNIMIVFVVSGLWHGANWTFIIWGAIHGLIYLLENLFGKITGIKTKNLPRWLQLLAGAKTFVVVVLAWVYFRAPDFETANDILAKLFENNHSAESIAVAPVVWLLILLFAVFDIGLRNTRIDHWLATKNTAVRWMCYAILLFGTMALGGVTNHPFIYFQF